MPFVEETVLIPLYVLASFIKYQLTTKMVYFWAFGSSPLICMPVFKPIPGHFDYNGL